MSIYKRGGVWWMDVYVGSGNRRKRVRKSTGCTEEVQARMIEQTMVAVNKGLTSRQRAQNILDNVLPKEERGVAIGDCRAFYDDCMKRENAALSAHELQKRLNCISRMSEWMIANTRAIFVSDITPEVAWAYSCAIGERDVTVKTRNNEIGHLRTVWKMLEKHGKVDLNPWTLARVGRNRDEEKHGRAFTDEEIVRLLSVAREVGHEWEGVITVSLYTGLRLGDVEYLRWDSIKGDILDVEPSKTKRRGVRVRIPLHPKIKEIIDKLPRDSEYVFPYRAANPTARYHKKDGDRSFAELLSAAGIVAGKGEKVSFHSLRHTFVTRLADAGVAEDVRMRLAGHTNAVTHGVYTHEDSQSKAAIGALK